MKANIAGFQARLAEQNVLPFFHAQLILGYNREARFYDDETVVVTNDGATVDDLSVSEVTTLTIDYGDISVRSPRRRAVLEEYYLPGLSSGQSTGVVETFPGHMKNGLFFQLSAACRAYGEARQRPLLIDVDRFFDISYRDRLGRKHLDSYELGEPTGDLFEPVTLAVAGRAFQLEAASDSRAELKLSTATPEAIVRAWSQSTWPAQR